MNFGKRLISRAVFGCFVALLVVTACGCAAPLPDAAGAGETGQSAASEPERRLLLTADENPQADVQQFSSEELGGQFSYGVAYRAVENVRIELGGQSLPLEEAIRSGAICEEDFFYYAGLDAKNGFCEETRESFHGLTHFTYVYPECNVRLVHDILEAPDGRQHLISCMQIYSPEITVGPFFDFRDGETGELLCREDWGLRFEVKELSSTGMTVSCTQTGGQQLGELKAAYYTIRRTDGDLQETASDMPEVEKMLQMDGTTVLTFDWEEAFGPLPRGEYQLWLTVYDIFDESQVHPLMQDYFDRQAYEIGFTID